MYIIINVLLLLLLSLLLLLNVSKELPTEVSVSQQSILAGVPTDR